MSEIAFVTVAIGAKAHAEMAVDLALSVRQWRDDPFVIVTDEDTAAYIRGSYSKVFAEVVILPEKYRAGLGRRCKFGIAEVAPCEQLLFIDADTLVVADPGDVLAQAASADFCMMGSFCLPGSTATHQGLAVDSLIREFHLSRYFINHSGAFGFNRTYGRTFLSKCYAVHAGEFRSLHRRNLGYVGDEPAFGIVAGRCGMTIMREPFPVYWPNEIAALRPDHRVKPFCHLNVPYPGETMAWLVREIGERRRRHDLPETSAAHWMRKNAIKQFDTGTRRIPRGIMRFLRLAPRLE